MSVARRLRFARARWPVATAMRVVAAARAAAAIAAPSVQRRSVFTAPRTTRRVPLRDTSLARAAMPPRGCEDLH